jgi:hypothetical protein
VKSDFCSASVFATGTGATTGLFMPMTFAVSRNAVCRAARERRLSPNAHGIKDRGLASPPSPGRTHGSRASGFRKAIAREHMALVGRAAGPEAGSHIRTSERP